MPTVSVIVPVYNVEPYLHRCVDSILAQTYKDFEVILVDDGSTDNCGAICDEYAARDQRVKVIHKQNGGVSSARNAGMGVVRGQYISFVDSDDALDPSFLHYGYECVAKQKLDLLMMGSARVTNQGTICNISQIPQEIFSNRRRLSPYDFITLLEYNYSSSPWSKLFSRELIKDIYFDTDMCFGEDLKFVWTALLKTPRLLASPETGYYYYLNPSSITSTVTAKKSDSMKKTYLFMFSFDKKYWGRENDTFVSFCYARWKDDYLNTIRGIVNSQSGFSHKRKMFGLLYHDRQLRQALYYRKKGCLCVTYNPLILYVKYKTAKAIKSIFKTILGTRQYESLKESVRQIKDRSM